VPAPLPPDREVAVELDAAKKSELAAQARNDLEEAARLIAPVRAAPPPAAAEKLRTVESMIDQARHALPDDPDAAATLARKARLLAEEIAALR
jgi:hypothetical protein